MDRRPSKERPTNGMHGAKFQVVTMIWTFQTGEGSITNYHLSCELLRSWKCFSSVKFFSRSESESEFGFCEDPVVDLWIFSRSKPGIRCCVFDRQAIH